MANKRIELNITASTNSKKPIYSRWRHSKSGVRGFQKLENVRDIRAATRLDKPEADKLDYICNHYGLSRGEMMRKLILEEYSKIKADEE